MNSLSGRVAIVTGAALGERAALGSAFALALASHGAAVVLADIRDTRSVAAEIEARGGAALPVHTDIRDEASIEAMVRTTIGRFGKVDILVNNAAIGSNTKPISILEITGSDWDEIFATNVRGTFLCIKAVLPHMRERQQGKIINIGSSMVAAGSPLRLHYVSAKGAIHAMTRALSRELGGDGIQVNTLAFGLITSNVNERILEEDDLYRTLVFKARAMSVHLRAGDVTGGLIFLASPQSDPMTGQILMFDPGSVHI